MICPNCGKNIEVVSRECPYCYKRLSYYNVEIKKETKKEETEVLPNKKVLIIYSLIPLYGYFKYFIVNEKDTNRTNYLGGALINTIIWLAIIILALI